MGKKKVTLTPRGMNRDFSISKFKPEFAFEARNFRLSTNEGNTFMSLVNEKGTKEIEFDTEGKWEDSDSRVLINDIKGTVIGTAIINNQLVLFSHEELIESTPSRRMPAKNSTQLELNYNFEYIGDSYVATVISSAEGEYYGNIIIPETVSNGTHDYTVIAIGEEAFKDCKGITSIYIPNTVTTLGYGAFWGCSNLRQINIPESIINSGGDVFYGCENLKSITITSETWNWIPNSSAQNGYFSGCYFAKSNYNVPGYITTEDISGATIFDEETEDGLLITDHVVKRCRTFTPLSITIPLQVVSVDSNAFKGKTITSVNIASNLLLSNDDNNMEDVFGTNVTEYKLSGMVSDIGNSAFNNCTSVNQIVIDMDIPPILNVEAFNGISENCKLIIPNNATETYAEFGWTRDVLENIFEGGVEEETYTVNENRCDHIYLLKYSDTSKTKMKGIELFHGNLGFKISNPLETLSSYESSNIQKVYWVDGINLPRMINISDYYGSYYREDNSSINSSFDFIRELRLEEEVKVVKCFNAAGKFPAGTILYAFTYYNKYGLESNIFYVTPLYYTSFIDRAGSPEESIPNAFKIYINNLDTNFEYLRVYSIMRTSLNGTPIVKRVLDVKIPGHYSYSKGSYVGDEDSETVLIEYLGSLGYSKEAKSFVNLPEDTKILPEEKNISFSTSSNPKDDEENTTFTKISDISIPLGVTIENDLPNMGELFTKDTKCHTFSFNSEWESLSLDANFLSSDEVEMTFKVTENNATLTKIVINNLNEESLYKVSIPSSYEGYSVTSISENIFDNNDNNCAAYIDTIAIPNTIKEVYDDLFKNCTNLKNIYSKVDNPNEVKVLKKEDGTPIPEQSLLTLLNTHFNELYTINNRNECILYVPLGESNNYVNGLYDTLGRIFCTLTELNFKTDSRFKYPDDKIYIFRKSYFPNLIIKYISQGNIHYFTWGKNSNNFSTLYYYPANATFETKTTPLPKGPCFICEELVNDEWQLSKLQEVTKVMSGEDITEQVEYIETDISTLSLLFPIENSPLVSISGQIEGEYSSISAFQKANSLKVTVYTPKTIHANYIQTVKSKISFRGFLGYICVHYSVILFRNGIDQEIVYSFNKKDFPNLTIRVNSDNKDIYYTWSDSIGNEDAIIHILPKGFVFYPSEDSSNSGKFIPINHLTYYMIICEHKKPNTENTWETVPFKMITKLSNIDSIYSNTLNGVTNFYNNSRYLIIDTNTTGEVIDPISLLYIGGDEIIAKTLEEKDGTLFLGNFETPHSSISEDIKQAILKETGVYNNKGEENITFPCAINNITCVTNRRPYVLPARREENTMGYLNTLSAPNNQLYQGASCFKSNEYYRLGVLFLYKTGKWSEPCWIGDKQWKLDSDYIDENNLSTIGPRSDESGLNPNFDTSNIGVLALPEFEYKISKNILSNLQKAGYKRIRAVYVLPLESDRTILCLGVVCPTVYRPCDRGYTDENGHKVVGKGVYAQSSWLFRSKWNSDSTYSWAKTHGNYVQGYNDDRGGGAVSYLHDNSFILKSNFGYPTAANGNYTWSGLNEWDNGNWLPFYHSSEVMGYFGNRESFFVDPFFGTVNSPDIEFNSSLLNTDYTGSSVYTVGYVSLSNTFGDIDIQTYSPPICPNAEGFIHNSINTYGASALISGNYYEDNIVTSKLEDGGEVKYLEMVYNSESTNKGSIGKYLWPVYMWHRKGSLNNDVNRTNRSAELKKKIISNYRYCADTIYKTAVEKNISSIKIFNANEASQIIKVNGHIYLGCVDMVVKPIEPSDFYVTGSPYRTGTFLFMYNKLGKADTATFMAYPTLKLHLEDASKPNSTDNAFIYNFNLKRWQSLNTNSTKEFGEIGSNVSKLTYFDDIVPIKYKSSPHIVMSLNRSLEESFGMYDWTDDCQMPVVDISIPYNKNVLYGGTSDLAFQSATWIPCGPVVNISPDADCIVPFKWGDTYYQRYECLKTYPYTPEDINQVVEIGSFYLETRINMDGRYDKNRGQLSNLNVTPQNFNLINPVYSQLDNFFNYRILSKEDYENISYPNRITWTKTKESGADVDVWANITFASTLELDGDKGDISKLIRFNDQLIAFQDRGISQILYNENTQISTTEGVPIEIANSGKVQGKRYLSDTVGCSNKWSITSTPRGIYFMDSNEKSIYFFNGEPNNLSDAGGFNTWCKNNIPSYSKKWNPVDFENFVTYYDKLNQDVLFINKETALAFSEKLGTFTSFYDYGKAPYFCNFEDTGIWINKDNKEDASYKLWKHNAGDYCRFFDTNYPYNITLVGNPEPLIDKIFTNLEFRANVVGDGVLDDLGKFTPILPFDSLEAWNEYQHGYTTLENRNGYNVISNDGDSSSLKRKFRIWRCDIPRNNYPMPTTEEEKAYEEFLGVSRHIRKPVDRMRNPWIYFKLNKNATEDSIIQDSLIKVTLPKVEIHDLVLTYF